MAGASVLLKKEGDDTAMVAGRRPHFRREERFP
jgi:hypothetical protein